VFCPACGSPLNERPDRGPAPGSPVAYIVNDLNQVGVSVAATAATFGAKSWVAKLRKQSRAKARHAKID